MISISRARSYSTPYVWGYPGGSDRLSPTWSPNNTVTGELKMFTPLNYFLVGFLYLEMFTIVKFSLFHLYTYSWQFASNRLTFEFFSYPVNNTFLSNKVLRLLSGKASLFCFALGHSCLVISPQAALMLDSGRFNLQANTDKIKHLL